MKSGYTSPSRLAGQGGSAGGILIGRAFTERPDLFAAILDDVGLSDMIRDMFSPDGPLNVTEYGGLNTEDGFRNLLEISAYYHDGVAWSPDGKEVASGGDDTAKVWDAESGKEIISLTGGNGSPCSVAWSPDGTQLALGSGDVLKVWSMPAGKNF